MPINSGRRGNANPLTAPKGGGFRSRNFDGQSGGSAGPGRGFKSRTSNKQQDRGVGPFRSQPFSTFSDFVDGITADAAGNVVANAIVRLFRTADDVEVDQSQSDGAGAFTLRAAGSGPFYVVAYKPGSPDVFGTTLNTLQPLRQGP